MYQHKANKVDVIKVSDPVRLYAYIVNNVESRLDLNLCLCFQIGCLSCLSHSVFFTHRNVNISSRIIFSASAVFVLP